MEKLIHIEVSDVEANYAYVYNSSVVPRIGEDITWFDDGNRRYGKVVSVMYEIYEKQFSNYCERVWLKIDEAKTKQ